MANQVNNQNPINAQQQLPGAEEQKKVEAEKKRELKKKIAQIMADAVITVGCKYASKNEHPYVAVLESTMKDAAHTSTDKTS